MYPEKFQQNSDFGTLKNDSTVSTISLTIPYGFVFNNAAPDLATETITIGTINAPIRSRITTTKRGGQWIVGTFILDEVISQKTGFPVATSTLRCSLYRSSPTTMSLKIMAEAAPSGPDTTVLETFTVTAKLSTFLTPFES